MASTPAFPGAVKGVNIIIRGDGKESHTTHITYRTILKTGLTMAASTVAVDMTVSIKNVRP